MIYPAGYRVLVKYDPVEEVSEGGIIIHTKEEDMLREKAAQDIGTVVALGPDVWSSYPAPWAKVGDRVSYSKHGGRFIVDPSTKEEYVLLNDEDITAVLIDEDD